MKTWRIMIKDLHLDAFLGIREQEKQRRQPVLINIECDLQMPVPEDKPTTEHIYCYNRLVESITKLISERHIYLVETLAEEIANFCLSDVRVQKVMVRVEKTRIYSNAASAGVEIIRHQIPLSTRNVG
jgi:dihydroneopterin aldolase